MRICGSVNLDDVDPRLAFASADARVWRGAEALASEIYIITNDVAAAAAFVIDSYDSTSDLAAAAGRGRLTARADVEIAGDIATVTALHLHAIDHGGTAWIEGAPRAALSDLQGEWHREIVLALAGVGTRRPVLPPSARPRGDGVRRLELLGEITAASGEALASSIRRAAGQTILLAVNSTGGNLSGAMAIYRALVAHDRRIEADIVEASSGAAIAVMGCDYRRLDAHGHMLVHAPHVDATGNARALRAQARILDTAADNCAVILAKGTRRSLSTVKGWLDELLPGQDNGRRFTAASALRNGLAHEVTYETAPLHPPRPRARFAPIAAPFRAIRAGRR